MIPTEQGSISEFDKFCEKYGVSYGCNTKRFAIHIAFEMWEEGLAWAFELWPFYIQRTPPAQPDDK